MYSWYFFTGKYRPETPGGSGNVQKSDFSAEKREFRDKRRKFRITLRVMGL